MTRPAAGPWRWSARIALSLVALLILALLAAAAHARRHSDWPERLEHVRLEPARPHLAPGDITTDNAFFYIREATNPPVKLDRGEWAQFSTNGWMAGTYTNLDGAVHTAAPQLDLLARAAAMPEGQVESITTITQTLAYISSYLNLSKLQAYQLAAAFGSDRADEGLAVARRMLANNAHMERGAPLIGRLVVVAADMLVERELHRALKLGLLSAASMRPAADLLGHRASSREPWSEAMRYETLFVLDSVETLYDGGVGQLMAIAEGDAAEPSRLARASLPLLGLVGSSRRNTRRHVEALYSHIVALADEPWRLKEFEQTAPLMRKPDFRSNSLALLDDPVGRILVAVMLPALSATCDRFIGEGASLQSLRLALLVESFRHARGVRPSRLEELVPDFIAAIPRDPFVAEGLLRYRVEPAAFTIYSVGTNGRDDDGDVTPVDGNPHKALDIGFRIEDRPPAP